MRVKVDLYKESGKWAYGGVVDVDESIPMSDPRHLQDLVDKQDFVQDGTFAHHYVAVTHLDSYDSDPAAYFCQALYVPGRFAKLRRSPPPAGPDPSLAKPALPSVEALKDALRGTGWLTHGQAREVAGYLHAWLSAGPTAPAPPYLGNPGA